MNDIQNIAAQLGSRGGQKTLKKYGKDYFKELNRKSVESRRKNKEQKEAVDKDS